ncbi:MAG: bifunctional metallophosphatase/5'-nucleotidase [Acidobacteria bacterium]|nr:bifunctional metallophosphatase/5'-nucleotidase [Acidobacteriota bacterium]
MLRWIFVLFLVLGLPAQELKVQVLGTTDLHGRVMPQDTYRLRPETQGWALLAPLIRERLATNPNTVLVDCGDALQGEPLNYVRTRLHPELPEPSLAAMKLLGYAAMTLGNHEFDWGLTALRSAEKEAGFPFLSANTVHAKDGKGAFPAFTLVERAGVRVAILGLTTPAVPRMAEPESIDGLRFLDPVESARTWVPRLREQERADLVVVAIHSGLGGLPGKPGDANVGLRLVDQVPGIDLLLAGHTHRAVESVHRGVPILEAQCFGRALAQAEFSLARKDGRWKVLAVKAGLLRPDPATVPDPAILDATARLRQATDKYLDTFATTLADDLDGRWCRIEDGPVMQLQHQVQREAVGAQLSAASVPPPWYFVPKGPASIRQFWALMPYENRLARIKITGAQLRAYLEHAAASYGFSHEPEFLDPEVAFYDVDTVGGCTYALDLSRPRGQRVTQLRHQGRPVTPEQSFTLALTTYRLAGGGGYMDAIGFTGRPEVVTQGSLRNLLFQHILGRPALTLPQDGEWRTIPAIDRERLLGRSR